MRISKHLLTGLLIVFTLLIIGCTGHLAGMKSPRLLTDEEKTRVIDMALKTPEVSAQIEKYEKYSTKLNWIAIIWNNSDISAWRAINHDWTTDPNFGLVSPGSEFYSEVVINLGEPAQWQVYVAVNPDTGKSFVVQENPFRTGPTPPKT